MGRAWRDGTGNVITSYSIHYTKLYEIRVHVDDHGPGIAPEDRERIFERFARGREDIEGTGIGLFLARELVRAHGGSILVETAQGGGSRFSVWLPQEPT